MDTTVATSRAGASSLHSKGEADLAAIAAAIGQLVQTVGRRSLERTTGRSLSGRPEPSPDPERSPLFREIASELDRELEALLDKRR